MGENGRIETLSTVFTNMDRNYPIKGVPDDVPGVAYWSGPKGWIDTLIMPQYLVNKRMIRELPNGCTRLLFVDNCRGHHFTDELEEAAKKTSPVVK